MIIPSIRGVLGFVTLISIMDVLRMFDNLIPLSPQAATIGNESIMLYVYSVAFARRRAATWAWAARSTC